MKNNMSEFIEVINDLSLSVFEEMRGEAYLNSTSTIEHEINHRLRKVLPDYLRKVNGEGLNPNEMQLTVYVDHDRPNTVSVKPNKELDRLIKRLGDGL